MPLTTQESTALSVHLARNCWPPQSFMFDAATDALAVVRDGAEIEGAPKSGHVQAPWELYGREAWIPAQEVIDNLNLRDFLAGGCAHG